MGAGDVFGGFGLNALVCFEDLQKRLYIGKLLKVF